MIVHKLKLVSLHYFSTFSIFLVLEYGIRFHANIQFNLYDVINWPLEWLFTVFSTNVARVSIKLLGGHKRITGEF